MSILYFPKIIIYSFSSFFFRGSEREEKAMYVFLYYYSAKWKHKKKTYLSDCNRLHRCILVKRAKYTRAGWRVGRRGEAGCRANSGPMTTGRRSVLQVSQHPCTYHHHHHHTHADLRRQRCAQRLRTKINVIHVVYIIMIKGCAYTRTLSCVCMYFCVRVCVWVCADGVCPI